jgi:uncharacterized protein
MKIFLIVLVVMAGAWLWRSNRAADPKFQSKKTHGAPPPLHMISCDFCSVHLPSTEAVNGKKGRYCSAAHCHQAEA